MPPPFPIVGCQRVRGRLLKPIDIIEAYACGYKYAIRQRFVYLGGDAEDAGGWGEDGADEDADLR